MTTQDGYDWPNEHLAPPSLPQRLLIWPVDGSDDLLQAMLKAGPGGIVYVNATGDGDLKYKHFRLDKFRFDWPGP